MTTDSTQPQDELGGTPADGLDQQRGHRRRRRRRKNKSASVTNPPVQSVAQSQPQAPQVPQPPQPAAMAAPPPRQNQQNQQNRRKKKFVPKERAQQSHQPGNTTAAPPQLRRKSKQRGPREFVGPMDHSYRTVNGNIADGPPSTIPTHSNGYSGSYYPENYAPPSVATPPANGPTRIFCFIEDLFFMAKIQETSRKLGVKVEFIKGDKEAIAKLIDAPEEERPTLLVIDLNNVAAKPMTLIPKLKNKLKKATSIIGFLSHLQGDLKMKAIEAGCDTVMPRSAFSQSLPNLLRRYGIEEEEELTSQPF